MYTQIIVPFDGSEFSATSIPIARKLARIADAPLKLVAFGITASQVDDLYEALGREAEPITDVEIDWSVQRVTNVVRAIADQLEEEPGALICMATVGRSHVAPVLGSSAEGVLGETYGPLLLVGPHVRPERFVPGGPMIVCTDGSDTAGAIVPVAAQWTIAMAFQPWVINVFESDAGVDLDLAGDIGPDAVYARHVAHELERVVERDVPYEVLHHDHPARAITGFADDNAASLIAMATHGETGARRVVLGSVTMSVVHHASCPVLVDRPPHLAAD